MIFEAVNNLKRYMPLRVKRFILRVFRFFSVPESIATARRSYPVSVEFPNLQLSADASEIPRIDPSSLVIEGSGLNLIYADRLNDEVKLSFLRSLVDDGRFLILLKSKYDFVKFEEYVGHHIDLDRVLFISTIDSEIDDEIYSKSQAVAEDFLDDMREAFGAGNSFPGFSESIRALNVPVSDRIQSGVRCGLFIEKIIKKYQVESFYFLSTIVSHMDLISFYVKSRTGVRSSIISTHCDGISYSVQELISSNWRLSWRPIISKYSIIDALKGKESAVLYFGNLKDPQYRGTAKPILNVLSESLRVPAIVLQSDKSDSDLRFNNTEILVPNFEYYSGDDVQSFIDRYDEGFSRLISKIDNDDFGFLCIFALMNARKALYRLLLDCYCLKKDIDQSCAQAKVRAIISNPGRLWFSQYLTSYLDGIPSFEIQSGTLSKTRRYQAPHSKFILSVDDFSKEVYCGFLGIDSSRVHVVGAPRIDEKLSKVRSLSPQESRRQACLPVQGELTCIATQPYGVDLMTRMVAEVVKLLEVRKSHLLVISMHPNETSEYEAAYRRVLGTYLDSGQAFISRGDIYHCMNAAENVVTFFSTSGIEAFCLKKRVFSFRPLDLESVPFDLCKLGVALPFSDSNDLLKHLEGDIAIRPSTIGLRNLQDGKSVSRICSFIAAHMSSN